MHPAYTLTMNSKLQSILTQAFVNFADFVQSLNSLKLTELFELWLVAVDDQMGAIDAAAKALAGPEWLTLVWDELGA